MIQNDHADNHLIKRLLLVQSKTLKGHPLPLKSLETATGNTGTRLSTSLTTIDDVQSGFNAIVNNIPQIVLRAWRPAVIAGSGWCWGSRVSASSSTIRGELTDKPFRQNSVGRSADQA